MHFRNKEEENFWKEIYLTIISNNANHYSINPADKADAAISLLRKRQKLSNEEIDQTILEQEKVIENNNAQITFLENKLMLISRSIHEERKRQSEYNKTKQEITELMEQYETILNSINKLEKQKDSLLSEIDSIKVLQESDNYRSKPNLKVIKTSEPAKILESKKTESDKTKTKIPNISIV